MEVTLELLKFIEEARNRGFSDEEIRKALAKNNWPDELISQGLNEVKSSEPIKTGLKKETITINLDESVMIVLKKRAKKNLLNCQQMAEDIIRRSCVSSGKTISGVPEKLDDLLVAVFSRKNSGRKQKFK